MRKYFGTDGIRGEVGKFPITPDFALKLGYAFGMVLKKFEETPVVIIGKDTRLSGYLFESSLEAGFSYAGVNVYMAGPIPTPAVAYLTKTLRLSAGVVISASHNPYMDNGIKFFSRNGVKLPDEVELEIERQLELDMKYTSTLGKVSRLEDVNGRYIEFCKSTFPAELSLNGLKIVIDCANGATYLVAPQILRELGADVIEVACEPNGTNINYQCGSTYPDLIVREVRAHNADLGIAFDGDGDRVIFADKTGKLYNGDKLIYIILKLYQLSGKSISGVVGTVMTNMGLELALKQNKIELVRANVGDRYVSEQLKAKNWLVGGESSGHILCLDKHSTGDGIISALQVLAAIIKSKKSLAELIDWDDYSQVMINVKLNNLTDAWKKNTEAIISEAGKYLGESGRVVVRASGTEPLIRVMVEATTFEIANQWAYKIADAIK